MNWDFIAYLKSHSSIRIWLLAVVTVWHLLLTSEVLFDNLRKKYKNSHVFGESSNSIVRNRYLYNLFNDFLFFLQRKQLSVRSSSRECKLLYIIQSKYRWCLIKRHTEYNSWSKGFFIHFCDVFNEPSHYNIRTLHYT